MLDLIKDHAWDIWSAVAGFLGGGAVGSLITIQVVRGQNTNGGTNVNQNKARSQGDLVGGNKTTTYSQKPTGKPRG